MAIRKLRNVVPVGKVIDKNPYMDFINSRRNIVYPEGTKTHNHHIIPIHDGGTFDKENEIKLSYQDHTEAHRLRYEVYKQPGDNYAYSSFIGDNEATYIASRQAGAQVVHAILRARKENFWDSEFQREMSRRSVAKDTGQRSAGGKKAGAKRWTNHTLTPEDVFLFYYQESPNSPKQEMVCTFNCSNGTQILNILNTIKPNPKFIRASPILSGQRQSAYGWSCELLIFEKNVVLFEEHVKKDDFLY